MTSRENICNALGNRNGGGWLLKPYTVQQVRSDVGDRAGPNKFER